MTQAIEKLRDVWSTGLKLGQTVADIDVFWTGWIFSVLLFEIGLRVIGGPSVVPDGTAGLPIYVAIAGFVSAGYSVVTEWFFQHAEPLAHETDCGVITEPHRSSGESMIPGAVGLALIAFAFFLCAAMVRNESAILLVGLPIVFGVAPLFSMFAFGYFRGEPSIGSFGYRKMPIALGVYVALGLIALLIRAAGVPKGDVRPIVVLAVFVALFFALNFARNWRNRHPEPPPAGSEAASL